MNPALKSDELIGKTSDELNDLLTIASINLRVKNNELAAIPIKADLDSFNKTKEVNRVQSNIAIIQAAIDALN